MKNKIKKGLACLIIPFALAGGIKGQDIKKDTTKNMNFEIDGKIPFYLKKNDYDRTFQAKISPSVQFELGKDFSMGPYISFGMPLRKNKKYRVKELEKNYEYELQTSYGLFSIGSRIQKDINKNKFSIDMGFTHYKESVENYKGIGFDKYLNVHKILPSINLKYEYKFNDLLRPYIEYEANKKDTFLKIGFNLGME